MYTETTVGELKTGQWTNLDHFYQVFTTNQ